MASSTTTQPTRHQVTLSGTTLEYCDSGGAGPALVLLGGILMDTTLWDEVVTQLGPDFRCVVPNLPLGAHRIPLPDGTPNDPRTVARLVAELIHKLGIDGCTVVGNDTGGAIAQVLVANNPELCAGLVLVSCDAFDNYPPGLTGKTVVTFGRLPRPLFMFNMQQLRIKPLRRLPIAFGWLTKSGDRTVRSWLSNLYASRAVQRDLQAFLRSMHRDPNVLNDAAAELEHFSGRAGVIWAKHDRVMPSADAERLAKLLNAEPVIWIDDSDTLIPLDQPDQLANSLRGVMAVHSPD